MNRKPYLLLLGVVASVLLTGAAAPAEQPEAVSSGVDSSISVEEMLPAEAPETEAEAEPVQPQTDERVDDAAAYSDPAQQPEPDPESQVEPQTEPEPEPQPQEEPGDEQLYIDGKPAPLTLNKVFRHDTTYVGFAAMVELMDPTAKIGWDQATESITVTSDVLDLSTKLGLNYVKVNGEYLTLVEPLYAENDRTMIQMSVLVKAMGGTVKWDAETGITTITRGSGALVPGTGEKEPPAPPKPELVKPKPEPKPEPPKPAKPAPRDKQLYINDSPAPTDLGKMFYKNVTYVALAPAVQYLDPSAKISWNGSTQTFTISSAKLKLTGKLGQLYMEANGRYLYTGEPLFAKNDRTMVPLAVLVKAMGGEIWWNPKTGITNINTGSGGCVSGNKVYNQDDLFWLSRIIYAEAGNQSLEGQMAVGNVILNRVADPVFPNTVLGVFAQKNQFSTYKGGKLAERTPTSRSILAAKLVMDGGVVEETRGALYFDNSNNSWAARHKTCIAVFGGHKFYK